MAVGDIEEFSDTPQPVTLANNSTDIPVFNIPEVKTPEPKKNIAKSSITNQIEKGKEIVSAPSITNMTQDLFDSITNESSVALSSVSTDISPPPEIIHVGPVDDKSKPVSEIIKPANDKVEPSPIESVENEPEISPDLPANYKYELSNKEVNAQSETYPPGYISREERENVSDNGPSIMVRIPINL